MSVEELIAKLQTMPAGYEVDVYHESAETGELTARVIDVERDPISKTVSLFITFPI